MKPGSASREQTGSDHCSGFHPKGAGARRWLARAPRTNQTRLMTAGLRERPPSSAKTDIAVHRLLFSGFHTGGHNF